MIYKVKTKGTQSFSFDYYDEVREAWDKRFITFKDHTYITEKKEEIAFLNGIIDSEKHLPAHVKKILSQDEFDLVVTPEALYVDYKGMSLHISEVRKGLEIAEKNGWKPDTSPKIVVTKPTISKVTKGGAMTAGSAAGGQK